LERTLTVRGARTTAVKAVARTAVSIHSSNAKPRCRALADFAITIHSQVMQPQSEGDIGGEFHLSVHAASLVRGNYVELLRRDFGIDFCCSGRCATAHYWARELTKLGQNDPT
jgi:hypothetical protein